MAVHSMTGYGCANIEEKEENSYLIEIKSVNHKYLKINSKLPEFLNPIQFELESLIKDNLGRGSVSVAVRGNYNQEENSFEISHEATQVYINQMTILRDKFSLSGEMTVSDLLTLPGVVVAQSRPRILEDDLREEIKKGFQRALEKVMAMREKEGEKLAEELGQYVQKIRDHLEKIEERRPQIIEEYQKKLKTRIEEFLKDENITLDPSDLARELAIYADKTDISEEIVRLHSHLDQFLSTLQQGRRIGRKLNFLGQEMLREANTMGAKTSDVEALENIVEVKSLVDKIKEQVQNIE